jgi:hypothetical protein
VEGEKAKSPAYYISIYSLVRLRSTHPCCILTEWPYLPDRSVQSVSDETIVLFEQSPNLFVHRSCNHEFEVFGAL